MKSHKQKALGFILFWACNLANCGLGLGLVVLILVFALILIFTLGLAYVFRVSKDGFNFVIRDHLVPTK